MTAPDPAAFAARLDGQRVGLWTLRSPGGQQVAVCNWGTRVFSWQVPGAGGAPLDVVLGLPSRAALQRDAAWVGAFVGRMANRIGGARLHRGNQTWPLRANAGPHCHHGGAGGCSHRVFEVLDHALDRLALRCTLPAGQDGFPGAIDLDLVYALDDAHGLSLRWQALVREAPTVCSFTSHLYFNLSGQGAGAPVSDHVLQIDADQVLALDAAQVPDGRLLPVAGTDADFRQPRALGHCGHDAYWVTAAAPGALARQARVASPRSGVAMEVWSTEPGLQCYAGGGLGAQPADLRDQHGRLFTAGAGLCLEPSGFPDAAAHPHFPDPWVEPGGTRHGRIDYRLSRGPAQLP